MPGRPTESGWGQALWSALERAHQGEEAVRRAAIEQLAASAPVQSVALWANEGGVWEVAARAGTANSVPQRLLDRVAEIEEPVEADGWWVGPVGNSRWVLAIQAIQGADGSDSIEPGCRQAAEILARVLTLARDIAGVHQRLARTQRILDLAAHWQTTLDMDRLLEQMAETSTELLDAERASIFLWDRQHHELVAHPALGVEGGELRVPDNAGVVGRVVQTGESMRVDPTEGDLIDRRVDTKLKFHTRSLLCVPLKDAKGGIIGAFEVINKKGTHGRFTAEDEEALWELARHASLALDTTQAYQAIVDSRNRLVDEMAHSVRLIGSCPAIVALREQLSRIAQVDLTVLIQGESGTGKEVVARLLHFSGARRAGPFVAVNAGAFTETLMESELFGHEKGAFTGADQTKAGKFEQASGGTLFLDEIGELSETGQVKLLRVLEQRVVTRVGGSEEIPIDVRVIAATNRDLAERVREGEFREDLFYRLSGVSVVLPPLRERGDDVIELAEFFLETFAREHGLPVKQLGDDAKEALRRHSWPGNIRELRNMMERMAFLVPSTVIGANDLTWQPSVRAPSETPLEWTLPLSEATREFQIAYIRRHIDRAGGSMTKAAEQLGLHRANLYRKMKQLGME